MGPIRSNRATLFVLGAIFFLAAFVGLAYNNLESWDLPDGYVSSLIPCQSRRRSLRNIV